MKAVIYTEYGTPDVLRLQEVAKPTPKENEILIRVAATAVNYGDLIARNFGHISAAEFNMPSPFWLLARLSFGWRKPKNPILGSAFSGEVTAVGNHVKRFGPGDPVWGYTGQNMGAYSEYLCMSEGGTVTIKPANMIHEEAAAVPYGAIMALNILRKVALQPGQKVLINGASGGIGSAAVQLAKFHYGARVTGVCGAPRMDFVKSLGADQVIDYAQEDFTQNGETYDLILDILGKSSFSRCKSSLTPNGIYLLASFKMKQLLQMAWSSLTGRQKLICALASDSAEDLIFIKELVEAGKIKTIIDRCYPLAQAAEAHWYAEKGGKKGVIIIQLP
jgi:NADPH:quinone reductase-like Zn-dependent oxidoreductase